MVHYNLIMLLANLNINKLKLVLNYIIIRIKIKIDFKNIIGMFINFLVFLNSLF